MSDDMLHAILQMPPDLWSDREIWQRHGRYLEASKRIMELERERDEARREWDELKRAAIEVLKVVPVAHCSEMYHGKRDMHFLGPCPVVERYNARIEKLRALLKEEAK